MAYEKQSFVDHKVDANGNVVTQGTTIKAEHFNHIEDGIKSLDNPTDFDTIVLSGVLTPCGTIFFLGGWL